MKKITKEFLITLMVTFIVASPLLLFYKYAHGHWMFFAILWLTSVYVANSMDKWFRTKDKCDDSNCKTK